MINDTPHDDQHQHRWGMSSALQWEYRLPPYRGILVAAATTENGSRKSYEAHIETPAGTYQAPHVFPGLDAAKQWVEHEIRRLSGSAHSGTSD